MDKMFGIINMETPIVHVKGIEDSRPVSAASFLGRYRILDFMLSNMTNSQINNIELYVKDRPRSTVEHVSGTNYNINTKRGSIHILGGEKSYSNELYNTDIANFITNMRYIYESNEPYVVIAPSYMIFTQDFNEMLSYHIKHESDITILYQSVNNAKEEFMMCDTLEIGEGKRVNAMDKNRGKYKNRDISLNTYIMSRELFIKLIKQAYNTSSLYWLNDIIADNINELNVLAYQHHGFASCINTLKSYFNASLKMIESGYLKSMTNENWPIFTRFNDDCPTMYLEEADVQNSIVANGCTIEGTVIDSVIGRNVTIKKGAVLKNCVILPSSLIGEDAHLENTIVDRFVTVTKVKNLKGTPDSPLYVKRGDSI